MSVDHKLVTCSVCDIGCQLEVEVADGRVARVGPNPHPLMKKNICFKGTAAPKLYEEGGRLLQPLKRVGPRGHNEWEPISYAQAMDEIADRLRVVVDEHGPEALAVSTSNWNTAVENGMGRRFMNLLGTPNWISGVAMCAGNTAAVNRLTYGWFPFPDLPASKCIVLFGHNPRRHSWTPIYNMINVAREQGAKLIVLDPRVSDQAAGADLHLPLRSGTDAAMCLGWLNVIIDEDLYHHRFVRTWTTGFDDLAERVAEYPVSRVAEICDVDPGLIREAARMYATHGPSVIPWTPTTDQQVSSTSAIRLQSILRAVCGFLDVPGGELLAGFNPDLIPESRLELHEALPLEQRAKQLGADRHPVYTHRAAALLEEATERVHGYGYANIVMGSYMAHPTSVFRAMADGDPYPVKAFFTLGNNSLMSYPNQQLVHRAMRNQDLIVAHELFLTPTAMLADYVLPGDTWLERPNLSDSWNWTNRIQLSEQAVEPPDECTSTFAFWRDLALRFGMADQFPWETLEDVLDHRLSPMGLTFQEFAATRSYHVRPHRYRRYRKVGFATPSGKVELRSSVLETLGFDPLPYHREPPRPDADFPFIVFIGVREDPYFQTGQRQLDVLRRRSPLPTTFLHPDDALGLGISDGDWVEIASGHGAVTAMAEIHDGMKRGHVRVPHGWWFPEIEPDEQLSGAFEHNDGMLVGDDESLLDAEQGVPHFKGFPGRVTRLDAPPAHLPAALIGPLGS